MKKMTNREIIGIINSVSAMKKREEEQKEKLFADKIKVSFALKKNMDELIRTIKPYFASRSELLEECRTESKDETGKWGIRKDCINKWEKGVEELLDIEVDVNLHFVKLAAIEGLSLSMSDLDAISFMIEDTDF